MCFKNHISDWSDGYGRVWETFFAVGGIAIYPASDMTWRKSQPSSFPAKVDVIVHKERSYYHDPTIII